MALRRPLVFEYLDYRKFIHDSFNFLKKTRKVSTREFREMAGLGSPSYLKWIVDGKRNISRVTIRKLGMAFEMKHDEILFFEKLVDFDHAVTTQDRDEAYQQILKAKGFRRLRTTAKDEYDFFSRSEIPILLEAMGGLWASKSEEEMAEALQIPVEKVHSAIAALQRLQFISRRNSHWVRSETHLETPPEAQSVNLINYHLEMIERSKVALHTVPSSDRDYQSMLISISEPKFKALKKKVQEFIREMASIYGDDDSPTRICQLSLQLFPIIDSKSKRT